MKITITKPELIRAASLFTGDDSRYYLAGVHFCKAEQGGVYIVSTDGHRASIGYDADGSIDNDCIVKFPKDFLKYLTEKRQPVDFSLVGDTAEAFTVGNDGDRLETLAVCKPQFIDGDFPDWRHIIPLEGALTTTSAAFNVDYLADFKTVRAALGLKTAMIRTIGTNSTNAHLVFLEGADNWFGVLMPVRTTITGDIPSWLPN
jgi:DNA polymerase III sliding clamp (beta) subunit (PCNA family)